MAPPPYLFEREGEELTIEQEEELLQFLNQVGKEGLWHSALQRARGDEP